MIEKKRKEKRVTREDTCLDVRDVLHAYLWKLLASPPPLIFLQVYIKPTLLLTSLLTQRFVVDHPSLFWRMANEMREKIMSYDLAQRANL